MIARAFVLVVALLACAATAIGQSTRIRDYAGFFRENDARLELTERRRWEIEIDEELEVRWANKDDLVAALRAQLPPPPRFDSAALESELDALRSIADDLIQAQDLFRQATDARLSSEGTEDSRAANALRFETEAADIAKKGLEHLRPFRERAPRQMGEFNKSLRLPIQQRFGGLAGLIRDRLGAVAAEIASRAVELEVQMEAHVRGDGGLREPVEVTGYFLPKDRTRVPFKRFQTIVDERTKRNLEAARELAKLLEPLQDEKAREKLLAEMRRVGDSLKELLDQILTDDLPRHLRELEEKLASLPESDANLRKAISSFVDGIEKLAELRNATTAPNLNDVVALFEGLGQRWVELGEAVKKLPESLEYLSAKLPGVLDAQKQLLGTDLVTRVKAHFEKLEEVAPELKKLVDDVNAFLGNLRISVESASSVSEVERVARSLNDDSNLDTAIVTETAKERRPGDRLYVRIWVIRAGETDPSKALTSDDFSFRLRTLGLYTEFEGGLIFADPRGSVSGGQDFEIAPAISYNMKYGWEDAPFWNDVLSPGLGVSLALLDFEDESDLEIGIAANMTLFNDLLWVGYGRNLQAEADYFYVGVNPLAIADLVQRGDER